MSFDVVAASLPDPLQRVEGTAGHAPARPDRSIRRTSTIDMSWPDGRAGRLRLDGRARDAVTRTTGEAPVVVGSAHTTIQIAENRTIVEAIASPAPDALERLIGCRGGGHLRRALAEYLPDELAGGTPLYLLLDDVSGASLVAGFAWSQWTDDWKRAAGDRPRPDMEGVCIGFAPGTSALAEQRSGDSTHRTQAVSSLVHPDDPEGWHEIAEQDGVGMRRARWIDVGRDPGDGTITISGGFQDSATTPDGGRVAVHEYLLEATADPDARLLTSVVPSPRVLPFRSCPAAVATASVVVGTPLTDLRRTVLERLARTNGCTHLNDVLRSLAEVPMLLERLDEALSEH